MPRRGLSKSGDGGGLHGAEEVCSSRKWQAARKLSMTFEGGGFFVHATFIGVMSSLLGASSLSEVQVLVFISGGTWISAELI